MNQDACATEKTAEARYFELQSLYVTWKIMQHFEYMAMLSFSATLA